MATWLDDTRRTYFSNATSIRDFRVQMRGSRSALLFGIYLFVLIGVTMTTYSMATSVYGNSVVNAQTQLTILYSTVMALLGGVVALVSPALTATTIVIERQRHSFDLIFSAPVRPRYYLVGKLLGSFRYTWMLLILSLPVTATCVMLGGASWTDVLFTYITLSFQGLIFTSFALLMSTVAPRPVSAVVWSYAAAGLFLLITAALSATSAFGSISRASLEAPFYNNLNPFSLGFSINTYSTIWGVTVPNWVFTIGIALIICRLCLLAAGAQLSPKPQKEIAALRSQCLLWAAFALGYVGYEQSTSLIGNPLPAAFGLTVPLLMAIPFMVCFGQGAERRYRFNGSFKPVHILDGTVAGAGPFLLAYALLICIAPIVGALYRGSPNPIGVEELSTAAYIIAFWFFWWATGRMASAFNSQVKVARLATFGVILFVLMIPTAILNILDSAAGPYRMGWRYINYHPLSPIFLSPPDSNTTAQAFTGIFLLLGGAMELMTARRIRSLYTPEELEIERVLATT